MKVMNWTAMCAGVLLAAGCGARAKQPADPEFDAAAPDFDGVALELTDDAEAEGRDTGQALEANVPEPLRNARDAVKALNHAVLAILSPIRDLLAENPDIRTGTTHVWERDIGNATYRFTMRKAAPNRFGWKGEVKAVGADDAAYQVVMGGVFIRNPDLPARRGRGQMGIDLDKLGAVDSAVKARGKLFVGFAHGPNGGKVLVYGLKQFTPDPAERAAIDAAFVGWRGPGGATAVRLFTHANIPESATAAQEKTAMRLRWLPTLGGRIDALAWDGDVPANHVYVVNACWNVQKAQGFLRVRDCQRTDTGGTCEVKKLEGDPQNCALGLREEQLPADDPNDASAESGAPETSEAPPSDMPDGSGNL